METLLFVQLYPVSHLNLENPVSLPCGFMRHWPFKPIFGEPQGMSFGLWDMEATFRGVYLPFLHTLWMHGVCGKILL